MGKHIRIRLTPGQRQELEGMIRAGEASARTLTRARILLLTGQGATRHRAVVLSRHGAEHPQALP